MTKIQFSLRKEEWCSLYTSLLQCSPPLLYSALWTGTNFTAAAFTGFFFFHQIPLTLLHISVVPPALSALGRVRHGEAVPPVPSVPVPSALLPLPPPLPVATVAVAAAAVAAVALALALAVTLASVALAVVAVAVASPLLRVSVPWCRGHGHLWRRDARLDHTHGRNAGGKRAECAGAGEAGQGGRRHVGPLGGVLSGHRAEAAGAGPTGGAAGLDAELGRAAAGGHKVAFVLSLE